jgi:hypothetical protein
MWLNLSSAALLFLILPMLLPVLAACGAGVLQGGPNPADKPGGVTNMQPGSGGSVNDVVRSEGNDPTVRPDDTPQSAGTDTTAQPPPAKEPPPPHAPPR